MSYEKQTWANGDVITATKLNHMEDGIAGGGVLVINEVYDEQTGTFSLDRTWQEIYNSGTAVVKSSDVDSFGLSWLVSISEFGGRAASVNHYRCCFLGTNGEMTVYTTDKPNGYPVLNSDK